jgi:hypothetical protein
MPNQCSVCGREVIPASLALGFCPSCGNPVGAGVSFAAHGAPSPARLPEAQIASSTQSRPIIDAPPQIYPILSDVSTLPPAPQVSRPLPGTAYSRLDDVAPAESPPPAQSGIPEPAAAAPAARRGGGAVTALLVALVLLIAGVGVLFATGKSNALLGLFGQSIHVGTAATPIPPTATATVTPIPPTATPKPTVPPPPPGYSTFISQDGTYGMDVPADWQHSSLTANDTVSDSFGSATTGEFIQMTESSAPITPSNIVSYLQSFVAGSNGLAFHVTVSAATVTINGNTWERAQGVFTLNGQGQSIIGLAIDVGGHGYVFIYTASVANFDTQPGTAYDQIVSSLTFLS